MLGVLSVDWGGAGCPSGGEQRGGDLRKRGAGPLRCRRQAAMVIDNFKAIILKR